MTGILWAALGLLAGFGMTALGDMASEEIRDRLDHLPHGILRLAACRLNPAQRIIIYHDEWLPELTYILKGVEARPITRLVAGTKFALGILISASRISRQFDCQPTNQAVISSHADKPSKGWIYVPARTVTVQKAEGPVKYEVRAHYRHPR